MLAIKSLIKKLAHPTFLMALCLILFVNVSTVQAKKFSEKIRYSKVKQTKPNNGNLNNVVDHDREISEKFLTMASLKLYGIYIDFYNQILRENVDDFDTALTILEEINDFSTQMANKTYSRQLEKFFQSSNTFFSFKMQLIREIAQEAKTNKFRQEFYDLIFDIFIRGKDCSAVLNSKEQILVDKWVAQNKKIYQSTLATSTQSLQNISAFYKIEALSFLDNVSIPINFKFPLDGDSTEVSYIYEMYIKDAELPINLKLYYRNGFLKDAIFIGKKAEIDLVKELKEFIDTVGSIAKERSNNRRVVFAYYLYKYLTRNTMKEADEKWKEFVVQLNNLDKDISIHTRHVQKGVEELLAMENKVKQPIPSNDVRYSAMLKLIDQTKSYLSQRTRITEYAEQEFTFSSDAVFKVSMSLLEEKLFEELPLYLQIQESFLYHKRDIDDILINYVDKIINNPSQSSLNKEKRNSRTSNTDLNKEKQKIAPEVNKMVDNGKFQVNGNLKTDIQINTGDTITITAQGSVLVIKNPRPVYTGPDGFIPTIDQRFGLIVKSANQGVLLVRVTKQGDEKWIVVGRGKTFVAPNSGVLELQVNDKKYQDNEGEFDIKVKIDRAK